ncbi:hypothetical protein [Nocardia sp. NPDC051570]|uniref:hypothetical protein n=1 Tax=Nocardia sp. NPDC051570 TaxID=3364324 RepID=UPI0037B4091D
MKLTVLAVLAAVTLPACAGLTAAANADPVTPEVCQATQDFVNHARQTNPTATPEQVAQAYVGWRQSTGAYDSQPNVMGVAVPNLLGTPVQEALDQQQFQQNMQDCRIG